MALKEPKFSQTPTVLTETSMLQQNRHRRYGGSPEKGQDHQSAVTENWPLEITATTGWVLFYT